MKEIMQALRPLIIAGPTASGKSAYALSCALDTNGVIINADSMQIYEDLPILTAHPEPEDLNLCPHKLYGIMPGSQACSVAMWLDMVQTEIAQTHEKDMRPIIVGGTGMYLLGLVDGLSSIPDIDPQIRSEARQLSTSMPIEDFYQNLIKLDPLIAGKIKPQDTQRLSRAYEVFRSTGKSITEWQTRPSIYMRDKYELQVIEKPRDVLHQRATDRFDLMLKKGAIEEVANLIHKAYNPDLPVMRALGVKELSAYIKGEITLEKAREMAIISTRQYIKRQSTFFNNQFPEAKRI